VSPDSSTPDLTQKSSPAENGSDAGLKLVDSSIDFAGDSRSEDSPDPGRRGHTEKSDSRVVPLWMLVATILLGIVVLGWQMQLASELQTEVASLEGQLDRTRAVVDAQRSHLGEIRGGVYALSDQLDGLRALVDGGPQEGSSDSSEPVPATSITP